MSAELIKRARELESLVLRETMHGLGPNARSIILIVPELCRELEAAEKAAAESVPREKVRELMDKWKSKLSDGSSPNETPAEVIRFHACIWDLERLLRGEGQ